jgi:hypothetical protein
MIVTSYMTSMNSAGLEAKHLATLLASVQRHLSYYRRLSGRMHQKHFPHDDPLRVATDRVLADVQLLDAELAKLAGLPQGDE